MKRRRLSSAPLFALALVACHPSTSGKAATTTIASSAKPAVSTFGGSAAPISSPAPVLASSPAAATPGAVAALPRIGPRSWISYTDGLAVSVLSATKFTPASDAIGPTSGNVSVLFSVRITNGTPTPYHAVIVSVTVSAGPNGAPCNEIFQNGPPNLGDTFRGYISPGESQTVPFGFDVPAGDVDDLHVSVQPDLGYVEATFTGRLTADDPVAQT